LITVNSQVHVLAVDEDPSLLWVLRDHLGLMGIKYSCALGECGDSRVLLDGRVRTVLSGEAGRCIRAADDHHFGWDKGWV